MNLIDLVARGGPNFDAVFTWARATGRGELAARLAIALWPYWWLRGMYADGLERLTPLLDAVEAGTLTIEDELLATLYAEATGLTQCCGLLDASESFSDRALAIKRRLGDEAAVASILGGSGMRASCRGDYDRARTLFAEGLAIRRRRGDRRAIAHSLCDPA